MPPTTRFTGFGDDALAFFDELAGNNERAWWHANKARFEDAVRAPMRAMLDELEPRFGTFRVFRMNRDVRYAADKSPYKTAHAALTETEGGSLLYVEISATGLLVGAGLYHPARDQLARWRAAVADDHTGPAAVAAVAAVRRAGLVVDGGREPPLTQAPRGFDRDHPRIELLRWKGCAAMKSLGAPAWLRTARAAGKVAEVWAKAAPLTEWLDAHVGPSELPPDR